jgi:hypothetical protein
LKITKFLLDPSFTTLHFRHSFSHSMVSNIFSVNSTVLHTTFVCATECLDNRSNNTVTVGILGRRVHCQSSNHVWRKQYRGAYHVISPPLNRKTWHAACSDTFVSKKLELRLEATVICVIMHASPFLKSFQIVALSHPRPPMRQRSSIPPHLI